MWIESKKELQPIQIIEAPSERQKNMFNTTGIEFFRNKTSVEALRDVCYLIEQRFVQIIANRSEEDINPIRLPEIIDQEIRKRIEKT